MKNKYIMTENGTTSIDQLPINPQISSNTMNSIPNKSSPQQPFSSNNNENIKIENYGQQLNAERNNNSNIQPIDYSSELNSTLKDITMQGVTSLPSRDIPQNTLPLQHDEQTKPNFVPDKSNDYIGDIIDKQQIIKENTKKQNKFDNLDYIYQELQMPLLVVIIYFLFQLPAVRKQLLSFLPSLYNKDGNPKLYGYLFNSIIFGILYFVLTKTIKSI